MAVATLNIENFENWNEGGKDSILLTKRQSSEKARDIMRTPDMFLSKQEREEKKRRLNEASLPPKPDPIPTSDSTPKPPTRTLNTPAMFKKPSQRPYLFVCV